MMHQICNEHTAIFDKNTGTSRIREKHSLQYNIPSNWKKTSQSLHVCGTCNECRFHGPWYIQ